MPSKSRKKIKGQARKANAKSNAALVIINSVGQNQWNVIDYRGSAVSSGKKKIRAKKKKLRLNAHMERSQEKVNDYSFSLLIIQFSQIKNS